MCWFSTAAKLEFNLLVARVIALQGDLRHQKPTVNFRTLAEGLGFQLAAKGLWGLEFR